MTKFDLIDSELMDKGTYLYSQRTMLLNPKLAFLLDDADTTVILQQIHYWIEKNRERMETGKAEINTYRDGRIWCFHTFEEWEEQFIWMSLSSIKRKIKKLEELGVLLSTDEYNSYSADRTKWYSIDYKKLSELEADIAEKMAKKMEMINKRKEKQKEYNRKKPKCQNETMVDESIDNTGKCQNETMAECQSETMPKSQDGTMPKSQPETMPECQDGTSNNNRLTVPETNLPQTNVQETNSVNHNQSVSPSYIKSKIERQREDFEYVEYILKERIEIDSLKERYDEKIITEIELNIMEMYMLEEITIKKIPTPQVLVRAVLNKLTYYHIEYVVCKFLEKSSITKVENTKAYLQSMIYNAPYEASSSTINDIKSKGLA